MNDTAAPASRLTVHADCDHPATKAARAACRRAKAAPAPVWVDATRESVAKGDTLRVTLTDGGSLEGELVAWGPKRLVMIHEGGLRHQLATDTIDTAQARA
jgi:endonuclease YncB( thermonuclease family)